MQSPRLRSSRPRFGLAILVVLGVCRLTCPACAEESNSDSAGFADEPAARALYDQMNETIRKAESLAFVSQFEREAVGKTKTACTYRIWLKKPNYFRMETQAVSGEQAGVLIGDGEVLWIYWPSGRPRWEYVKESEDAEATRLSSYMTKPAPQGKHSIWHEAVLLGGGMSLPILEASIFHGYVDSMEAHIDAVRILGMETIGGEVCDKIEVRMLGQQRRHLLWLSRRDHLPRKLKEIVRVSWDNIAREEWSSVVVNGEIPDSMFTWQPPADWQQWSLPNPDHSLPMPGSKAPAFDLESVEGKRIKLSDYQGKTVWLCFWRLGCPPCRVETPYLQNLYSRFKHKGFVVLGVNVSDDRELTLEYLRREGVAFPNIIDTSDAAVKACEEDYSGSGVPMNCLVDGDGIVLDAWIGHSEERAKSAMKLAGIDVTE